MHGETIKTLKASFNKLAYQGIKFLNNTVIWDTVALQSEKAGRRLLHIVTPTCIILPFCHNNFIDVYCHMFIAALEFMLRRSRETALRTLYAHACREIRAVSGTCLTLWRRNYF